ncbi:MAG: RICIN domain-containing protein [Oscillospiraceae bacterium]
MKDVAGNIFEITRGSDTYPNYRDIYEAKFKNNASAYNWLIPTSLFTSQEINAGYAWKYRWYYDKLNGYALDYYRDRGLWGMRSNWVEIGCTEMTYHMKKCLGIKQGMYHVINNQSGKYVSSIVNASGYPTQSDKTCFIDQYWDFRPAGDGTYEIVPLVYPAKRLTATDSGLVMLSSASGGAAQKWKVVRTTDTTFTIVSVAYNTYLSRASTTADYIALTSTLSTTGYWRIANVNAVGNGIDKLINVNSSKLASVTTNGSYTITQQTYAYNLNQMWQAKLCADGYFQLIPLHSQNVCLTATSSGQQIAVQTNTEADTQKWLIVADSVSGNYRIHSKAYPNKMLTSASSSTSVGTGIKLNSDSTSTLAKWKFESLHGDGSFVCRLRSVSVSNTILMKADNESTGHDVVQRGVSATATDNNYKYLANFIWEFQLQPDGFYKIIPLSSIKKCLTAANTSSSPAVLSLHCDKEDDSQKWVVIQLSDGKYRISPKNNITKSVKAVSSSSNAYLQLETFSTSSLAKWTVSLFNVTSFVGKKYKLKTQNLTTQNESSRFFDARDDNSASVRADTKDRDDIVTIYSEAQNNSQTWLFRMVDGFYEILPVSNYSYRMSAILTSLTAPSLRKKYADDSSEQRWIIEEVASDIYRIAPRENPSMAITLATDEITNKDDEDGNYLHLGIEFKDTDKERITFTYVP